MLQHPWSVVVVNTVWQSLGISASSRFIESRVCCFLQFIRCCQIAYKGFVSSCSSLRVVCILTMGPHHISIWNYPASDFLLHWSKDPMLSIHICHISTSSCLLDFFSYRLFFSFAVLKFVFHFFWSETFILLMCFSLVIWIRNVFSHLWLIFSICLISQWIDF